MNESNRKRSLWMAASVAALIAGGLALVQDRLPQGMLAASAGQAEVIQGMIGKATHAQQGLETRLGELSSYELITAEQFDGYRGELATIRSDLQLAFNLMNAGGASPDLQGFYYARLREQEKLQKTIEALRERVDDPEALAEADGSAKRVY